MAALAPFSLDGVASKVSGGLSKLRNTSSAQFCGNHNTNVSTRVGEAISIEYGC
jgi:hypothetical protein